jgi:hypothetical protein
VIASFAATVTHGPHPDTGDRCAGPQAAWHGIFRRRRREQRRLRGILAIRRIADYCHGTGGGDRACTKPRICQEPARALLGADVEVLAAFPDSRRTWLRTLPARRPPSPSSKSTDSTMNTDGQRSLRRLRPCQDYTRRSRSCSISMCKHSQLHHHSVVSRPGQDSVGPSGEGVPRSVESQLHSMMHDSAQWQSAQLTRLDGISGCGRHG